MAHEEDGFEVEFRWKEEIVYWEGPDGFLFDGGWGVSPAVTYVPAAALWSEVMPDWLRERRDVVVARLGRPGTVVVDDEVGGSTWASPYRRLRREL